MKAIILAALASLIVSGTVAGGRTFTDNQGRKLEGELLSADDEGAVIKRDDGRTFTIRVTTLSIEDQEYILEAREELEREAAEIKAVKDAAAAAEAALKEIVKFCQSKIGKQVGDGECWTLANEAFNKARAKRPGGDGRVWGREVDYKNEKPQPGDIVEIEGAKFANGMNFPSKHTSVIVSTKGKHQITVCEQNINGNKTVQERAYDLRGIKSGKVKIYRYEGKSE